MNVGDLRDVLKKYKGDEPVLVQFGDSGKGQDTPKFEVAQVMGGQPDIAGPGCVLRTVDTATDGKSRTGDRIVRHGAAPGVEQAESKGDQYAEDNASKSKNL
jgi:hypothetical protein